MKSDQVTNKTILQRAKTWIMILVVVFIAPLLVPLNPSLGTVDNTAYLDPDSQFLQVNGVSIHYKQYGQGEPTFILLHGTLATTYTWHKVIDEFSAMGTVIVYDRPAFGLTSRPMPGSWSGAGPYGHEQQADLLVSLMDALKIDKAILVGHSLGGAIAGLAAQKYPERVSTLILVAPGQTRHGVSSVAGWLFATPQMRHIGPIFLRNRVEEFGMDLYRNSYHDPEKITDVDIQAYSKIFAIENFYRAIWELLVAARPLDAVVHYEMISAPTLVITGDDDNVLGTENNIVLADIIPQAELSIIRQCGHIPQEECPQPFMDEIHKYLDNQGDKPGGIVH